MALHKIRKGLDLPIRGEPTDTITDGPTMRRVAVVAADFVGMKPRMMVNEGDSVRLGQKLFEDRKNEGVFFTAPAAGKVVAVNRGAKRALQTVVVEAAGSERETFTAYKKKRPQDYTRDEVCALLQESGEWTALRARPFSKVPAVDAVPDAVFVTAIDTHPLAPNPETVIAGNEEAFYAGLVGLEKLTEGPLYLCRRAGGKISPGPSGAQVEEFTGKHPAGVVGTHIHFLHPVSRQRQVWHVGYQDVVSIGHLLQTGSLHLDRVISLAGPSVTEPRLVRTRRGASTDTLTEGQLESGDHRVISGSVLSGRSASGEIHGFLGRYHNQVSVIPEDDERKFMGWLTPGFDRFSSVTAFPSNLLARIGRKFTFTTTTHGSPRAIVPIGMYERVMPLDMMPTHLLRAIVVGDVEWAQELGVLELDEEDLSLCTFVCPGKMEYGPVLRQMLDRIDKEG